ncbi:DUF397 domain-containing protein [Kitasatospora sp. RB6PN24]|uniref:DUF397 domain-containing protein n=1 Tax=Kitasatospora humi TaxID=2893891 RepID=UPI001E414B6E|nr:DUF397 domain-containing protein [Kitasatospora humi]MCC9309864.1 DUF397 domain-containing protein [Kitasatospora humi]
MSNFLVPASTAGLVWRKSTFSGAQSECVEVADGCPGVVPVRDSKNPDGPALTFTAEAWSGFIHRLREGGFRTP